MSVVPDFLNAILAAWLGSLVLTRTPREYVSRVFALLALVTAAYGVARVVSGLTLAPGVARGALRVEDAAGTLLPAALLHIVLAFTAGRRMTRPQRWALFVAYPVSGIVASIFLSGAGRRISVRAVDREILGIAEPVVAWTWVGFRALVLGLAIYWGWRAWNAAGRTGARRSQLTAILAAVVFGSAGGLLTILGAQLIGVEWPGTTVIAVSLAVAAYAIVGRRAFLAPDIALRSFVYSLAAGLLTAAYVILLLGLERLSREWLAIDAPLLTLLALVLTIALFDPLRDRLRALLDGPAAGRQTGHRRLRRALGDELLTAQHPEASIGPALSELSRALRVSAAAVVADGEAVLATYGAVPPVTPDSASQVLPLQAHDRTFGALLLGPKDSRSPYTPDELDLLADAATYMAAALQLAERHTREAAELDALSAASAALQSKETALSAALNDAEVQAPGAELLRIFALGPLRVERGGEIIRRWGGAKAGTRQAEAVFAFLFDRGERGVTKDEFVELIWPDTPLDKADLAFHRTLGGLRRMLEPDLKRGSEATTVVHHNGRYRLDPAIVGWSDVAAFGEQLAVVGSTPDTTRALAALEAARALYRGDYLDDCPFYGDSSFVEERRKLLHGRFVDVLLALGEHYEARNDSTSAAACYREALQAAGDDCPRADDGLARLGLPL